MKILFASSSGYMPEFRGGVQASTDSLVRKCLERNHETYVLASLFGQGLFGAFARLKLKLGTSNVAIDRSPGYPVIRAWEPKEVVGEVTKMLKPDVVVAQCHGASELATEFEKLGVPVVLYLRNVEFEELRGDPSTLKACKFIANSQFTRERYKAQFGIESVVIPPLINREQYAVERRGRYVTFINPVEKKGLQKFLDIAKMLPSIPFVVVEGWLLDAEQDSDLKEKLAHLPNVHFRRNTRQMADIYAQTQILLVPSMWEEAWGRVASEAHCSGIPVVGSNKGGLPEAIGPGGFILDYEAPLEDWVRAITDLWTRNDLYKSTSDAALKFSMRPEMNERIQFETFIKTVTEAASRILEPNP